MRTTLFLSAAVLLASAVQAQNELGKTDDLARIALFAYVSPNADEMPAGGRENLANKLRQMAVANGLGNDNEGARFLLYGKPMVINKVIQPGAPSMTVLELEVSLFVGDGIDGTLFSTTSKTVKGVGENETKAYINAFKNIQVKDSEITEMLETGKTRIIEYYNSNCDFIIQKAMALSGQEKYDAALAQLAAVPTVCTKCHEFASEAAASVYKSKLDRDCRISMAKAKAEMAAENYKDAAMALATGIMPDAICYEEASKLMGQIEQKAEAKNKRDWDFKMKEQQDATDITKKGVEAWRQVGIAYGENQQQSTGIYNVGGWR